MKKHSALRIATAWVLVAACMAVIFFLSAQPGEESENLSGQLTGFLFGSIEAERFIRKCAHMLEYTGLAVLIFNAFKSTCGYYRPFISFLLAVIYACTDEFHQLFVEGRAGLISDVAIDAVGAAAGIVAVSFLAAAYEKIRRRKLQ